MLHIENKTAPLPTFTMQHVLYYTHTDAHRALLKSQKRINLSMCSKKKVEEEEEKAKATNYDNIFFFKII